MRFALNSDVLFCVNQSAAISMGWGILHFSFTLTNLLIILGCGSKSNPQSEDDPFHESRECLRKNKKAVNFGVFCKRKGMLLTTENEKCFQFPKGNEIGEYVFVGLKEAAAQT
ncbi:hypothetical protein VNO78_24620 [Psophocarpus tetragonolobus]|uniref:Uncharacterized protein n=1 Tax=Psophocarpus tetragonolobus TaxID=3891 RepID=A0AAN9S5X8_PSOTE